MKLTRHPQQRPGHQQEQLLALCQLCSCSLRPSDHQGEHHQGQGRRQEGGNRGLVAQPVSPISSSAPPPLQHALTTRPPLPRSPQRDIMRYSKLG